MAQNPMITFAAGVTGAIIGLLAPMIAAGFTRLGLTRQAQRDLGNAILDLLSETEPGDLRPNSASSARRRLYILGIRLRDDTARQACTDLVAVAGRSDATDDEFFTAWRRTLDEVGRVTRGER